MPSRGSGGVPRRSDANRSSGAGRSGTDRSSGAGRSGTDRSSGAGRSGTDRSSGAGGSRSRVVGRSRAGVLQSAALVEIQRSRLIAGAVCAIDEVGYTQTTVGHITRRASVSRRTFYDLFADREECLVAVLEDLVEVIAAELAGAGLDGLSWRERVRGGLGRILALFDREPVLARVCVVQALRGGPRVLKRREEILAGLAAVVDEGRGEGARGGGCTPLMAEGLVGAGFAIVYARLLRGGGEPLVGLLGELMGMIVLPYLGSAAAHREQARPAASVAVGAARPGSSLGGLLLAGDPLQGARMRLTYRTARVLEGVAELGGRGAGPSNRMVAEYAGVSDQGQISKHLRRLERAGLLANLSAGHAKGEPNAWALTARGELLARSIRVHDTHGRRAA